MKCDVCNKEATVFLTQIINGQMKTVNLCDACSKEKGVTDTMGFGLAEAFLSPTGQSSSAPLVTTSPADACPSCGFTYSQLKKIGRMGCPECYSSFREGLDSLLSAMHKGTRHVGKTPTDARKPDSSWSREEAEQSIERLRTQIQKAVSMERYEDAAKFKAAIDSIQRRLAAESTETTEA